MAKIEKMSNKEIEQYLFEKSNIEHLNRILDAIRDQKVKSIRCVEKSKYGWLRYEQLIIKDYEDTAD